MNLRDLPLGSMIVRNGLARVADVRHALIEAQENDCRLGDILLERGLLRERDLARLLAELERLDVVDLDRVRLDEAAVACLPESLARRHRAVAIRVGRAGLLVAVADPTDDGGLAAIRAAAGDMPVRFLVAQASDIDDALVRAYGEPRAAA